MVHVSTTFVLVTQVWMLPCCVLMACPDSSAASSSMLLIKQLYRKLSLLPIIPIAALMASFEKSEWQFAQAFSIRLMGS